MSDDEIIALMADGSIAALEQLYNSTCKSVYAFIFSMVKNRAEAEDLMHDTYMRIFEKASAYQPGTCLKTWMMTVAKNITYDYFRKAKQVVYLDDEPVEQKMDLSQPYENVFVHIALEEALKKLPDLDAQIAVLYAACGYKHKEIAQILSIPEGTVRRRYREAIKRLADAMGGISDGKR